MNPRFDYIDTTSAEKKSQLGIESSGSLDKDLGYSWKKYFNNFGKPSSLQTLALLHVSQLNLLFYA